MRTGAPLAKALMVPRKPIWPPIWAAPGDYHLDRLTAALGVENVELDAMLLEDAGILAELRHEGLSHPAAAHRKLEPVIGKADPRQQRQCGGQRRAGKRSRTTHQRALPAPRLVRVLREASKSNAGPATIDFAGQG